MLLWKVKATIKKYNLINKRDTVLVGVSGGPDSLALLFSLYSLQKELHLTLHIAHLDHGLRKDSYLDAEFLKKLALRLKMPATFGSINVKKIAKKGSTEEIARNARLSFLFKTAKSIHANKIALGHNLNDQAETILMRILRGTGLYGLSGILPKRTFGGFQIIRPLLEVQRREIERYVKQKKIVPRRDYTNAEDIYFRNKIRNNLFPVLEKNYNSNIKNVLAHMAESIAYDYDYLNLAAQKICNRSGNRINLIKFARLHPAIQRLLIRLQIAKVQGDTRRISFQHVLEIQDLVCNRPFGAIVDLPNGISVEKRKGILRFYRKKPQ